MAVDTSPLHKREGKAERIKALEELGEAQENKMKNIKEEYRY
jgi:hypothetical protein